jgi:hypothetical protein
MDCCGGEAWYSPPRGSVENNNIGEVGARDLADALAKNTALTSLKRVVASSCFKPLCYDSSSRVPAQADGRGTRCNMQQLIEECVKANSLPAERGTELFRALEKEAFSMKTLLLSELDAAGRTVDVDLDCELSCSTEIVLDHQPCNPG